MKLNVNKSCDHPFGVRIGSTTKYKDCGHVALDPKFKFALGEAKIRGDAAEKNRGKVFLLQKRGIETSSF